MIDPLFAVLTRTGVRRRAHSLFTPSPRSWQRSLVVLVVLSLVVLGVTTVKAQSFTTSTLQNVNVTAPTSLQFGPDGRLYVSQQDGTILALTVTKNGANDYAVTDTETLSLIQDIPNHNDDGELAPAEWQGIRQVTGIYVTENPVDPSLPMLYVGSSDPRIGAGSDGTDADLDTNSGIITKLTYDGTTWSAVDLVRGLPRSEENHSTNGLQLDASTNTLLVAQGGHTNAGAASNNFALTTEYALSAAILSVDLDAIEALPTQVDDNGRAYKYVLPTLNDPDRPDVTDGTWTQEAALDEQRHETAFVEVGGLFYLLGGRESQAVRIYDPVAQTWSTGATMPSTTGWPDKLHHFQAVTVNGKIYAVGGMTGNCCSEPPATNVYVYDPASDAWSIGPEIPVDRRRGGGGAAVYQGQIYLVGGNEFGHSGPASTQFDAFDPATGTWTTLPDAPHARDHFYVVVVDDKLYVVGGRESDDADGSIFNQTVPEVDVYDFAAGTWSTLPSGSNLPTPRAAAATAVLGDEIIVAGGESAAQNTAHEEVEAFDPQVQSWRTLSAMLTPRHGTQAVVSDGTFYVAAGSPNQGGPGGAQLPVEAFAFPANASGSVDPNDPFGGNDGLNQAKIDPTGPVQIYSPGWRNAYDLVLTEGGILWAVDNGPNPGWGGHPLGEADFPSDPDGDPVGACTNDYDPTEPGSSDTGPGGDPKVNNVDGLHVVTPGYYAGHPTPVRGNLDAGIYVNGTWLQPGDPGLPADWNELVPAANPAECDYRNPGETDGALVTWNKKSVNGIAEYPVSGDLEGDLVLTSLNDGTLKYVDVSASGTGVVSSSNLASGLAAPLDVTITDTDTPFPGVIWTATFGGGGSIAVLEPEEQLVCGGADDDTIDEDGDGYTNADEIDNGTNLCSASDLPANNDAAEEQAEIDNGTRTFLLSDLNDSDDDNDGVDDATDPFQVDASNGTSTSLPLFRDLFLGSINQSLAGGVGFTGLMANGTDDYQTLFDADNLLTGGATGQFSIVEVPTGTAAGTANTQQNGFQFGVQPPAEPYLVEAQIVGPYFNNTPQDGFEQGLYIGTGDQDNYIKMALSSSADFTGADGGIEIVVEEGGVEQRSLYPIDGLVGETQNLSLRFLIDPAAGTVQPSYAVGGGSTIDLGSPLSLSAGALLAAVEGTHEIAAGVPGGLAVGVTTTTGGAGSTFQADYEFLSVRTETQPVTLTPVARINAGGGAYTDGSGNQWSGNQYENGGRKYSVSTPIASTEDDPLYQSEYWGDVTYSIPVPEPGSYTVRLHFAEIYWGVNGGTGAPGERVFNVYLEGNKVLDQIDINALVGPATALIQTVSSVAVSDATLDLQLEAVVNNGKISAIEVLKEDGAPDPTFYSLTTQTSGSGTVTKAPDQASYASGTTVTLTAEPDAGWEFVEWTGDVTGTANPVTATVNSDLSVTAVFQETISQVAIATSVQGNGTVVKNPDQPSYDAGTVVELTAVPDAGWYFTGWSGDATGTQNPLSVTADSDLAITASFEELPTAEAFASSITVTDASGESISRTFGVDPVATTGFDPSLDRSAPPAPPTGAFDARFDGGGAGPLFSDIRAPISHPSTLSWSLAVQGSDTPLRLEWDPSLFPQGTMTLTSGADGTVVDMKAEESVSIDAPPTDLTIEFAPYDPSTLATASQSFAGGWDLWGSSLDVGATPFPSLVPLAQQGSLLGYDGAYGPESRIHPGRGYWVNLTAGGSETIEGFPIQQVQSRLDAGWNLIAGPNCTVDLPADVTAAYVYDGTSYQPTTQLAPFEGTWVNVAGPTTLTFDCNAASQTLAATAAGDKSSDPSIQPRMTLHIQDATGAEQVLYVTHESTQASALDPYLLPPSPPRSVFDVRFAGDRRASTNRSESVFLQSAAYPLSVRVDGPAAAGQAVEQTADGSGRTHSLRSGASFSIDDPAVTQLRLDLPESVVKELPESFALRGNYPNPFRGSTTLQFDLPEEADVTVEVYNLLGQRVMEVNETRLPSGAGQTLRLEGDLASGVYLYRIQAVMGAQTVRETGKMVVVR